METLDIVGTIQAIGLDAGIFVMLYILLQKFIDKMDTKLDKLVEAVNEIKGALAGRGDQEEVSDD